MASPTTTAVTAGSWVKVVTNMTCVTLWILKQTAIYAYTYRDTGGAVPTLLSEGTKLQYPGKTFESANAFDVYIWCLGEDGSLRIGEDFSAEYLIDA